MRRRYVVALVLPAALIFALVAVACRSGNGANACTLDADGRGGYGWGWTAGLKIYYLTKNSADVDFTDPLQAYRPGYADGFATGVGQRHAGIANNKSTAEYPSSIGYQRGFRDGSEDGYADLSKAPVGNPSPDYGNGYFDGFLDGLRGKDALCD